MELLTIGNLKLALDVGLGKGDRVLLFVLETQDIDPVHLKVLPGYPEAPALQGTLAEPVANGLTAFDRQ